MHTKWSETTIDFNCLIYTSILYTNAHEFVLQGEIYPSHCGILSYWWPFLLFSVSSLQGIRVEWLYNNTINKLNFGLQTNHEFSALLPYFCNSSKICPFRHNDLLFTVCKGIPSNSAFYGIPPFADSTSASDKLSKFCWKQS